MKCAAQDLCTSVNVEDVVVVASQHIDVWNVCHIHSAHTRIGFVHLSALHYLFPTNLMVQVE